MRALAVVLVLLYHAHVPGVHAGFLGVDVFFVISGFVITNVLLKERFTTGGTSLLDFCGRRIRRILPAATVVVVATVFATYHWLSFVTGATVADDAKWVTMFASNFHFAAIGTNYFTQSNPPSTLQHFWSLAVEEQFYFVWPVLFLVATTVAGRRSRETFLVPLLLVIMATSLTWSITQTPNNPTNAFFSPFTRSWELALGALLAVTAPRLRTWPRWVGRTLRGAGVATILLCTWFLSATSSWPGAHSITPVLGAGAMIAGGTVTASQPFDLVTRSRPVQWVGLISYSLYLVHWPILTIASEYSFTKLPLRSNLELVALSVVAAALSYYLVERPVQRWRWLQRHRWATYVFGALLIGLSFAAIYWHLHNYA